MKEECVCSNCGYTWRRGFDGSHSCSEYLNKEVERLKLKILAHNKTIANINDIMFNSFMIKNYNFGRLEGKKIMSELEKSSFV